MILIITILATLILYWIYDGYGRFLQIMVLLKRDESQAITASVPKGVEIKNEDRWPTMTVLLTVHNEETIIRRRIENILQCDYPDGTDRLRWINGLNKRDRAIILRSGGAFV